MSDEINETPQAPETPAVETPVVETPKVEEAPVVEQKIDTPVEQIAEEKKEIAPVEEKKEELKAAPIENPVKEVEELRKSLSVIQEVRVELAKAYSENNTVKQANESFAKTNESLSAELNASKKQLEELSKELETYKAREAEAHNQAFNKRVDALSKAFKEIGQDKSVEELSKKDEKVLEELEAVVKLALNAKKEEQLNSLIVPSQAQPAKIVKKEEKLSSETFFKELGKRFQVKEQYTQF